MIVSILFRRVVRRILMRPDKPKEIPLPNLWLKFKQSLIQDFASKELEKSVIIVGRESIDWEVDGNITFENARKLKNLGANIFVAGTSSIFKDNRVEEPLLTELRACVK